MPDTGPPTAPQGLPPLGRTGAGGTPCQALPPSGPCLKHGRSMERVPAGPTRKGGPGQASPARRVPTSGCTGMRHRGHVEVGQMGQTPKPPPRAAPRHSSAPAPRRLNGHHQQRKGGSTRPGFLPSAPSPRSTLRPLPSRRGNLANMLRERRQHCFTQHVGHIGPRARRHTQPPAQGDRADHRETACSADGGLLGLRPPSHTFPRKQDHPAQKAPEA